MPDEFEAQLRDALTQRAAELPQDASAGLAAADYRPRTGVRPRVALGILAGAGASAGAAITIASLSVGTSSAFAGWSATPTTPSSGEISNAVSGCENSPGPAAAPPGAPSDGAGEDWNVLLTDTRGPFTIVVLSDGSATRSCFASPTADFGITSFTGTAGGAQPAGAVSASVAHLSFDGQPYTVVNGQTSVNVTATTLLLSDGTQVQATISNGMFVAWWPGTQDVTSAALTTQTGTTTQPLQSSPTLCPSAPAGGASSCVGVVRAGPLPVGQDRHVLSQSSSFGTAGAGVTAPTIGASGASGATGPAIAAGGAAEVGTSSTASG